MPLRCPNCNRFRKAEEIEASDVELENIGVAGDEIYGSLEATLIVTCPECGEEIGTLECYDVEVHLGSVKAIEPTA